MEGKIQAYIEERINDNSIFFILEDIQLFEHYDSLRQDDNRENPSSGVHALYLSDVKSQGFVANSSPLHKARTRFAQSSPTNK